jgi:hypothetical protein
MRYFCPTGGGAFPHTGDKRRFFRFLPAVKPFLVLAGAKNVSPAQCT